MSKSEFSRLAPGGDVDRRSVVETAMGSKRCRDGFRADGVA